MDHNNHIALEAIDTHRHMHKQTVIALEAIDTHTHIGT
jgi:hypothetical protein